jgi:hypothetical protein
MTIELAGYEPACRIAANDNEPVFDRGRQQELELLDNPAAPVRDDDTPTGIRPIFDKELVKRKREAEKAAMELAKAAIAARQQKRGDDWDGAANDNEDFPLLSALRREGDNDSIDLALKYRKLVALAECEPLQGQRVGGDLPTEYRSTNLTTQTNEAIEAAVRNNWDGDRLTGGDIRYKQVKKRKGGTFHLPAKQAVTVNDETKVRTAPLAMKFDFDLIIYQIDAKRILAGVRAAIGPLLDPFEDAVLGGQTYTQIGRREDIEVKPDVAGKALVKRAIIAAEGAFCDIERKIPKAEREADRRARLRRAELAVAQAKYLGRAA